MGDMADVFRDMDAAKQERRSSLEPTRFEYATDLLMDAGHRVAKNPKDDKSLIVNGYVTFWPYTGWYSGKGIGSGRGIKKLMEKLA